MSQMIGDAREFVVEETEMDRAAGAAAPAAAAVEDENTEPS